MASWFRIRRPKLPAMPQPACRQSNAPSHPGTIKASRRREAFFSSRYHLSSAAGYFEDAAKYSIKLGHFKRCSDSKINKTVRQQDQRRDDRRMVVADAELDSPSHAGTRSGCQPEFSHITVAIQS